MIANVRSITEHINKIKEMAKIFGNRDFFTISIIVLTALASFGLGRLSALDTGTEPISISHSQTFSQDLSENVTATVVNSVKGEPVGGLYVASKKGAKYFFPWCSGAKAISEANKIWFDSKESAVKAGYEPATNCKGL